MLETVAVILTGYAGSAEWPWWSAVVLGALAGTWNACNRFYRGPMRARLEIRALRSWQRLLALVGLIVWSSAVGAALCWAIFMVARGLAA